MIKQLKHVRWHLPYSGEIYELPYIFAVFCNNNKNNYFNIKCIICLIKRRVTCENSLFECCV